MTTNVYFGVITLTSSGMLIRLLRCALDKLNIVLSMASVEVVIEYV